MIKKITVIGSGLMGSAIAAHFANVGCEVNLLDIVDKKDDNRSNISSKAIKNLLKINVTINVVNGWLAKSYNDHAITSLFFLKSILNLFIKTYRIIPI